MSKLDQILDGAAVSEKSMSKLDQILSCETDYKKGDTKSVFGKPMVYDGSDWVPDGGSSKDADKGEKDEKDDKKDDSGSDPVADKVKSDLGADIVKNIGAKDVDKALKVLKDSGASSDAAASMLKGISKTMKAGDDDPDKESILRDFKGLLKGDKGAIDALRGDYPNGRDAKWGSGGGPSLRS